MVVLGYASYTLIGWGVLCLPICNRPPFTGGLDHLFTAASAVSTTGLVTVSTFDRYSTTGQVVIAALIQLGGLGYMTVGSFVMLAAGRRVSMNRERVWESVYSLPAGVAARRFIPAIVLFTLIIEALGTVALYVIFRARGQPEALWFAGFHSVSAFCTAGFALFNDSFMSCRSDVWLNVVIITLSYLGAVGFLVLDDVRNRIVGRKLRLSLSSRVILWCTLFVSLLGTALLFLAEPLLRSLPPAERLLAAWFQAMTASTTVGFNTVDTAALSGASVFLVTIIMIIGASPSGTGGGIKTTTVATLWASMVCVLRGKERTTFGDREIPSERVRMATACAVFFLCVFVMGTYTLSLVESTPLPDQMFECASAIGTVGLSRGITPGLSWGGKLIIIALMFAGRVGPLALGATLLRRGRRPELFYHPREDLAI